MIAGVEQKTQQKKEQNTLALCYSVLLQGGSVDRVVERTKSLQLVREHNNVVVVHDGFYVNE